MRQTKNQETQGEKKKESEGSVSLRETVPSLDTGERRYNAANIQI